MAQRGRAAGRIGRVLCVRHVPPERYRRRQLFPLPRWRGELEAGLPERLPPDLGRRQPGPGRCGRCARTVGRLGLRRQPQPRPQRLHLPPAQLAQRLARPDQPDALQDRRLRIRPDPGEPGPEPRVRRAYVRHGRRVPARDVRNGRRRPGILCSRSLHGPSDRLAGRRRTDAAGHRRPGPRRVQHLRQPQQPVGREVHHRHRRALRALRRLRRRTDRQAGRPLRVRACLRAARLGVEQLPRPVAEPDRFRIHLHRLRRVRPAHPGPPAVGEQSHRPGARRAGSGPGEIAEPQRRLHQPHRRALRRVAGRVPHRHRRPRGPHRTHRWRCTDRLRAGHLRRARRAERQLLHQRRRHPHRRRRTGRQLATGTG